MVILSHHMPRRKIFKFAKTFLWGASISSHQTEGGNLNDWTIFEKENAERLAIDAAKEYSNLPNWPEIEDKATDPKNYISGRACDFWNNYKSDFELALMINLNALRLSIEWSRIEPKKGSFNLEAIMRYLDMIDELKKRKIEPIITLWHFTLPLWVAEKGGWQNPKTIKHYLRYVQKMVRVFKGKVKYIITINEPEIYAGASYYEGIWPPMKKNIISYLMVIRNLIKAHQKSYILIKSISKRIKVGIAKNNVLFEKKENTLLNRLLKRLADYWWNDYFLKKINNYQDFIGLNYYFRNVIDRGFNKNENKIVSNQGIELNPSAIYDVLKELKKFNKPIIITENGLADANDVKRPWFLEETLKYIHRAMRWEEVPVIGYLHWSLIDNFEWDKGFWPRYGLIEVDYQTQKRTIRPSAFEYSRYIKETALNRAPKKKDKKISLIKI